MVGEPFPQMQAKIGRQGAVSSTQKAARIDERGNIHSSQIEKAVTLDDLNQADWNWGRIVAKGNHIPFFLNGKLASEFTDDLKHGRLDRE